MLTTRVASGMTEAMFGFSRKERLTGNLGDGTQGCLSKSLPAEMVRAARYTCARAHLAGSLTLTELRDTLHALGLTDSDASAKKLSDPTDTVTT